MGRVPGSDPFVEPAGRAEEAVDELFGGRSRGGLAHVGDPAGVVRPHKPRHVQAAADEPDGPLEHGRRGTHGVVPVDLAEHDVAGEHHELRGGAGLGGDGQRRARLVEAEAGQQAFLVEVAAVRHAGVEAVPGEIVHLVDVDGPGEHRCQDPAGGVGRRALDQAGDPCRIEPPVPLEHPAGGTAGEQAADERLVAGNLRQAHVLDGVAVGPVAHVVEQGGGREGGCVVGADDGREAGVAAEPGQEFEGQPVDTERVLEPGMDRAGVDEAHEPELAHPGQPPHLGGVEQGPDPRRQRHRDPGRNADALGRDVERGELGQRIRRHDRPPTAAACRPAPAGAP